jgi:hypothetical protein
MKSDCTSQQELDQPTPDTSSPLLPVFNANIAITGYNLVLHKISMSHYVKTRRKWCLWCLSSAKGAVHDAGHTNFIVHLVNMFTVEEVYG